MASLFHLLAPDAGGHAPVKVNHKGKDKIDSTNMLLPQYYILIYTIENI